MKSWPLKFQQEALDKKVLIEAVIRETSAIFRSPPSKNVWNYGSRPLAVVQQSPAIGSQHLQAAVR